VAELAVGRQSSWLAMRIAFNKPLLQALLQANVSVCCGIKYDGIGKISNGITLPVRHKV
jgi:hypothetical protein